MKALSRFLTVVFAACICVGAVSRTAAQTLTMWSFLDPSKSSGREIALRKMIEAFEAANPGVKIRVEPQIYSELMTKFLAANVVGNAPDLVLVNTESAGALINARAGADLNALIVKDWPAGAEDDFFLKPVWNAVVADGKRYAVPLFPATSNLFYRGDLLEAAGIDPASIKTWDQLADAAQKLTIDRDKDGRIDVWGFGTPLSIERSGSSTAFTPMMEAAGKMYDGCTPHYATPAGMRSLNWHVDMIANRKAMSREVIANHIDDIVDQFTAGKLAIGVLPLQRFDTVRNTAKWDTSKLGILPWPNWTDEKLGPLQAEGWYVAVWAKSKNVKLAARFAEHLISPESVKLWATVGGQLPTRRSVWNDPEFRKPQYAYMQTVIEAWSNRGFLLPPTCNMMVFSGDLNKATQRVLLDNAAPQAALIEAEKQFTSRQR